jgi:hypothetical protein
VDGKFKVAAVNDQKKKNSIPARLRSPAFLASVETWIFR